LLHRGGLRASLHEERGGPAPDKGLFSPNQWHGRTLQRRVAAEVLPINVANHADLETLLLGFNRAYNQRRQRVLGGISPAAKVNERLARKPQLANRRYLPPTHHGIMQAVDNIMSYANDVSQPDN
jgi:hypothetical protein